jgi:hypothetical protein
MAVGKFREEWRRLAKRGGLSQHHGYGAQHIGLAGDRQPPADKLPVYETGPETDGLRI